MEYVLFPSLSSEGILNLSYQVLNLNWLVFQTRASLRPIKRFSGTGIQTCVEALSVCGICHRVWIPLRS